MASVGAVWGYERIVGVTSARSLRATGAVLAALAVAFSLGACSTGDVAAGTTTPSAVAESSTTPSPTPQDGETATWELRDPAAVSADATSIDIGVTRLGCSGGHTGEPLAPTIAYEDDRILMQIDVPPLPPGAYTCIGGPPVRLTVELDQPVGERELVDGACLEEDAGRTAMCEDHGVRWPVA